MPQTMATNPAFHVGDIVRVLPAFRGSPARYVADGAEGIYVVLGYRRDEVFLYRCSDGPGDAHDTAAAVARGELTDADYDIALHPDRITKDLNRSER